MPANEFEKKLQQKMGELNLAPSEEVWLEVERRIRKEKKRRRFIIWFFLCGTLALGGGILLTKSMRDNKDAKSISKGSNTSKIETVSIPLPEKSSTPQTKNAVNTSKLTSPKNIKVKNTDGIKTSSIAQDKNLISENKLPKNGNRSEPKQNNKREFINDVAKNYLTNIEQDKLVLQIKEEIRNTNELLAGTSTQKDIAINVQNNKQELQERLVENKDSSVGNEEGQKRPITENRDSSERQKESRVIENLKDSMTITTSENKTPTQIKKNEKWKLGLFLQPGRSNIVNGIKFSDKSLYADAASSPTTSTGGPPQNSYISPINSSGSIAAGLYFNRSLTKRLEINLGLDYSYLSAKMNIGNNVDSSIVFNSYSGLASANNFYSASAPGTRSYKSQYHFFGLSAELAWKFINKKKFQVYWNNALGIGHLFSSNALRFDRNLPGYYKDYGSLNHDHVFFSTGLSIPIFKRFELNPLTTWSLTHIWRTSEATKTNFSNYGIRIKFFLNNK